MKYIFFLIATIFSLTVFSQQFELSPSSSFSVDGTSTLLDWTVRAQQFKGSSTIESKKSASNVLKKGAITNIHLIIPVSSMISEKGSSMDNKMYRAFKMEEFPEITYTLSGPVEFDVIDTKTKTLSTIGILYIAGVKKTIESEVEATFINKVLTLTGKVPLKLSDFDMERPSAMFGQIETHDDITVNFVLKFKVVN